MIKEESTYKMPKNCLTFPTTIFTLPTGSLVELTERNFYMSGGGGGYVAREALNENVNGSPATLFVQQSKSGNALSGIVWDTSTTSYQLRIEENVRKNGQYAFFLNLARSIPIEHKSENKSPKDGKEDIGKKSHTESP